MRLINKSLTESIYNSITCEELTESIEYNIWGDSVILDKENKKMIINGKEFTFDRMNEFIKAAKGANRMHKPMSLLLYTDFKNGKLNKWDTFRVDNLGESYKARKRTIKESASESESIGSIENIDGKDYYVPGNTFNGYCYKDANAYNSDPDKVCYITEHGFESDDKLSVEFVEANKEKLIDYGTVSTKNSIRDEIRTVLEADKYFYESKSGERIEAKDFDNELIDILADDVFNVVDWQTTSGFAYENDWTAAIEDYYNKFNAGLNESADLDVMNYMLDKDIIIGAEYDHPEEYEKDHWNSLYREALKKAEEENNSDMVNKIKPLITESEDRNKELKDKLLKLADDHFYHNMNDHWGHKGFEIEDKYNKDINSIVDELKQNGVEVYHKNYKGKEEPGYAMGYETIFREGITYDELEKMIYDSGIDTDAKVAYEDISDKEKTSNLLDLIDSKGLKDKDEILNFIATSKEVEDLRESVLVEDVPFSHTAIIYYGGTNEEGVDDTGEIECVVDNRDDFPDITDRDIHEAFEADNLSIYSNDRTGEEYMLDIDMFDNIHWLEFKNKTDDGKFHFIITSEDNKLNEATEGEVEKLKREIRNRAEDLYSYDEVPKLNSKDIEAIADKIRRTGFFVSTNIFADDDDGYEWEQINDIIDNNIRDYVKDTGIMNESTDDLEFNDNGKQKIFYFIVGICLDENRPNADENDFYDMPDFGIPYKLMDENFGVTYNRLEAIKYVQYYIKDGVPGTFGAVIEAEAPEGINITQTISAGWADWIEPGDIYNFKKNGGKLIYCGYSTKDKTVNNLVGRTLIESSIASKRSPERKYISYVFHWINNMGYTDEFKKVWGKYAGPEYDDMSMFDIMRLVYDELYEDNGFNGELFASPEEFFDNEYLEDESDDESLTESAHKIWSNTGTYDYYSNMSRDDMIEEIKANGWDEEEINGVPILDADDEDIREYLTPQDIDLDAEDYAGSIEPMIEEQCYNDIVVLCGRAANWRGSGEACKATTVEGLRDYIFPSYDAHIVMYCDDNDNLFYTEANHDTPMGGTEMYLYSFHDETDYDNAEALLKKLYDDEGFDMYYFSEYAGYKDVSELIDKGLLKPIKRNPNYVGITESAKPVELTKFDWKDGLDGFEYYVDKNDDNDIYAKNIKSGRLYWCTSDGDPEVEVDDKNFILKERYFPGAEEKYFCNDCGLAFNEDQLTGTDDEGNDVCPACGSTNIIDTGSPKEESNQVGLWVNGKVYWEGSKDDVDENLLLDVADQASEEDGTIYNYDEVDIKPINESVNIKGPELDKDGNYYCEWCGSKFKADKKADGSMPNCPTCYKKRYKDDPKRDEDGHANKDVHLIESAKPKKKAKKKKEDEKRVIMQQGNVTCFKENDNKYVVFENENDNEKEYKDQESAMQDFMTRVGVDPNTELKESVELNGKRFPIRKRPTKA